MGPTFEQFMMCYVFWIPWHRILDAIAESRAVSRAKSRAHVPA
jgi:hypothetical protein